MGAMPTFNEFLIVRNYTHASECDIALGQYCTCIYNKGHKEIHFGWAYRISVTYVDTCQQGCTKWVGKTSFKGFLIQLSGYLDITG